MKKLVEVYVTTAVEVTVDAEKFSPEFLARFERNHWPMKNGIDDHVRNLAELYAAGGISEGDVITYGGNTLEELGVSFRLLEKQVSFDVTHLPLELDQ